MSAKFPRGGGAGPFLARSLFAPLLTFTGIVNSVRSWYSVIQMSRYITCSLHTQL